MTVERRVRCPTAGQDSVIWSKLVFIVLCHQIVDQVQTQAFVTFFSVLKNVLDNILIAHIYLLFSIGHDTEAPPEKTTTEYYGKIAYIFVWKIAEFILISY